MIKLMAIVLVSAITMMTMASAQAGDVYRMDAQGDGNIMRLHLETGIGVFSNASLDSKGNSIRIRLQGADLTKLTDLIGRMEHRLLGGIKVFPGQNSETILLLELRKPVVVLDETIVALPNDHSSWELVLAVSPDKPQRLEAVRSPSLSDIRLEAIDGKLNVVLTGSADLVAEVYFMARSGRNPPSLAIELPGVSGNELESALHKLNTSDPLIRRVRVVRSGSKEVLIFDLNETVEMVDNLGTVTGGQGRIMTSIVPDSPPVEAGKRALAVKQILHSIEVAEKDGTLSLSLDGVADMRVGAYTLDQPPRLVLDFLGWKPEQIRDAVSSLELNRHIFGARTEATQLGSARAVFELSQLTPLLGSINREGRLIVSLRSPESLDAAIIAEARTTSPASAALPDVRSRYDLSVGKRIVIRPVALDGKAIAAPFAAGAEGKEYGLLSFFQKALNNDAKYRASKADFDANSEMLPQARAGYLPTAAFDFQRSNIRQNITRASNPAFPTGVTSYPNLNWTLTITQPLIKAPAYVKVSQAELGVEQARLNLVSSEQDLILRVSSSYLALLAAQDVLDMARSEREAMEKQHELASSRLSSGLGTITQLHDVEARFALTQAKEIEAENKLDDARQGLKEIIGETVKNIHGFKGDFDGVAPQPDVIDPWVAAALEQNLALQSRNLAVQISSLEVQRQKAGYLPTINLVGSVGQQHAGGSIYGTGQKSDNAELGIRMNAPLYEGGMTTSLVREALAREAKAGQEHEQERRRTERQVRSAFLGVQASSRVLDALRKAVVAQDSALQSRLEGYRKGIFSTVAVLDAYRLFFSARRDYLQARYDYLVNRLKLKMSVGTLSRNDLEDLSELID